MATSQTREVLIAGAGIGGLTLALALHEAGVPCRIVEAAPRLDALGVGINILPHASRELHRLGLGPELDEVAVRTRESRFYNRFGQFIHAEPLGRAAGYAWPQYSIHRGDLQLVLARAVRERLGADAVALGARMLAVEQDDTGVTAVVQMPTGEERLRADVLVGCDGVHSAVRSALHPTEPGLRYAGCTMWRGVARWPAFLGGDCLVRAGWLSTGKMVIYPIRDDADDGSAQLVNWVAELDGPQRAGRDWKREGSVEDILGPFADWHFDWLDVPALMRATTEVLEYPMVDQEPLPRWSFGRDDAARRRRAPDGAPRVERRRTGHPRHPRVHRPDHHGRRPGRRPRRLRRGPSPGHRRRRAGQPHEPAGRHPARGPRAHRGPAVRPRRGRHLHRGDGRDPRAVPPRGGVLAGRPPGRLMRAPSETRAALRAVLARETVTVVPGGGGPLDAVIAARAGFEAFFLAGSQVAAHLLGVPDAGVLGLSDMAGHAGRVAARADIPVLVDADTGYGNAVNVFFAIRELVRSGAAGAQIEDQEAPKKSGTGAGRRCIPVDEAVGKYRAAVRARDETDPAFVVCARTDAIGAEGGGFEDAVARCVRYVEEGGADVVWLNSVQTREQVREACARIPAPVMTVWGGSDPAPDPAEYARLGLRIALYPVLASKVGLQATWEVLHDVHDRGPEALADWERRVAAHPRGRVSLPSLTEQDRVRELESAFLPAGLQRDYTTTFGHRPST